MNRIVVSGSLAYDFISAYDSPFEEVLLPNQLNKLSVCFVVSKKERHFGGTGGNIAYNLALLSASPSLIAGAGSDFEDYRDRLGALGVDMTYVDEFSEVLSATATIISDPKGNQISEFFPGAMIFPGRKDPSVAIREAQALIISPDNKIEMMRYVKIAKKENTAYFFDPGQGLPLFEPDELLEAIDGAEGVFLNDYELELFRSKTGLSEKEIVEKVHWLIVTMGAEGSRLLSKDEEIMIPIVKPEKAIDPTGCGDAYRAGFLKGFVEGWNIETCARMGSLMGMFAVEKMGTQNHKLGWGIFVERFQSEFGELPSL
jgi:adenosine kinase